MSRLVTIEVLRIRVDVDGTGPPLLLIMGIGGNIERWGLFGSRLAGFRTIAFDLPGARDSEVPWRLLGAP
jgi:pimeloyl-ACP methyl ester carboxylesterase